MQKVEKNLPKATVEIVKEYDELQQKLNGLDPTWTSKTIRITSAPSPMSSNNHVLSC